MVNKYKTEHRALKGEKHPFYGKNHTEISKQMISINNSMNRSVMHVNTKEVFRSAAEAGRKYKIHPSGIIRCCTGKQKTAAKSKWCYYDN